MSGHQATVRAPRAGDRSGGRPRRAPRGRSRRSSARPLVFVIGVALLSLVIAAAMSPALQRAIAELSLPLRHEEIIRFQAADKGLDPSLIAAVIYVESRFRDQTSPAGAKGLMQIMPGTAEYIAQKSGGSRFVQGDLATPEINIAYGSWYLRYLLERYGGNELLAIAAYNGGEGKVDEWIVDARRRGETFSATDHIPFPETRDYVARVFEARLDYRRTYPAELGF